MNEDKLTILREGIEILERAAKRLDFAIDACSSIGLKQEYDAIEDTYFESLAGKFKRDCDYLVNRVFRQAIVKCREQYLKG